MNPVPAGYRETTHATQHCLNCKKCITRNAAPVCDRLGDAPPDAIVMSLLGINGYIKAIAWVMNHVTDDNHICDEADLITVSSVSRMVITRGSSGG